MGVAEARRRRRARDRLRPVDWLLAGYLAIVTVVALRGRRSQPGCWWLLAAHALFVLLALSAAPTRLGPVGRTVAEIYPLLLLVGLYGEIDMLNGPGDACRSTTG